MGAQPHRGDNITVYRVGIIHVSEALNLRVCRIKGGCLVSDFSCTTFNLH